MEASDFLWQTWFMIRHYNNRYMFLSPENLTLEGSPAAIPLIVPVDLDLVK